MADLPEVSAVPIKLFDWLKLLNSSKWSLIDSTKGKGLTLDQLEEAETELKELEETVLQRTNVLESELKVLNEVMKKKEQVRKRKPAEKETKQSMSPKPSSKRERFESDASVSSITYTSGKEHKVTGSKLGKGDALDKLWTSVEAYCRDITEGDLTFLEEQMKPEEGILDIPPLGKHYSNQWATEDILEEKKNGSFNMDKTDISLAMDIDVVIDSSEKSIAKNNHLGPLTQRLIAAFVDEGVSPSLPLQPDLNSSLQSKFDPQLFEERLKSELTNLGILDTSYPKGTGEDEILEELQKKQEEYKAVTEQNKKLLSQLYNEAKKEIQRQEVRRKLEEVDKDVMKWMQTIQTSKQRKKHISERDRESARMILDQRIQLLRTLDELQ